MKSGSRSNALLVELLIVVLFFMISATVLMQIFSAARMQGEKSGWLSQASSDAQNLAEKLSASQYPKSVLSDLGFVPADENETQWKLEGDGFLTEVTYAEESLEYGLLLRQQITVYKNGELMIELPVAQYQEVQP